MARDDPPTRYPLPPEDISGVLPPTIPWDTPIAELSSCWLAISCDCGTSSLLPLRLMAAQRGWKLTLRSIVPRLRCKQCGGRPGRVVLTVTPAGDGGMHRGGEGLVLVG